jgi:hypothetical protein
MILYHYSSADFKGYISPKFFGVNNYSKNSERISGLKRVYFYLDKNGKEYYFNGSQFIYIAEIKKELLYDLNKDPLKISDNKRIKDIFYYIKRKGFKGLIGSNGHKVGVLFYSVKIKNKIRLTI